MKKKWLVSFLLAASFLAAATPSSGTIVFLAFADLSSGPASCGGGTLYGFWGYHSGVVWSRAPGDYGRSFKVEGKSGKCAFTFFPLSSCTDWGSAGILDNVDCDTYFEQICNEDKTYKATTLVAVTDGGGESASDATSCMAPSCGW